MNDEKQKYIRKTNEVIKGNKMYHVTQGHKYQIKFNTSSATRVNILDKTATSARNAARGRTGGGDWILRLDGPHRGANFNHVNINSNISGVADPHIKLPPGGLEFGTGVAKFCKVANKVNKVAVPLAIAMDVYQTGSAICEDIENDTSRNTVETVAGVAGAWGGGYAGAAGGAALGTAIFPGIGTIVGGIIGALGGGILGSETAKGVTEIVADELDYDMEWKFCKKCGKKFKARLYRGDRYKNYCSNCR